jgi:hypothetical protein
MTVTDDMMGGPWEQEARRTALAAAEWINGGGARFALHKVERAAQQTTNHNHKHQLEELLKAVRTLETEVVRQANRVDKFRDQVGQFVAALQQALTIGDYDPEPEPARLDHLENDEVLERLTDLYGLPKRYAR